MIIFKRTLNRLLSLKFFIIYFLIFIPILILLTFSFGLMDNINPNYNSVLDRSLANFFIINFMWILGVPFLITIASRGSSLIQQEIDEETLVLLVSKPINRLRIYLEKWLATYVVSFIVAIISILLSLTIYILIFKLDSTIILQLFKMVPGLIIYILFINFIFTSISVVITLLLKNRIRSIILLIVLVMLIEFIFPVIKSASFQSDAYVKNKIYLFDLNYHFGIMYFYIMKIFAAVHFTPTSQESVNSFITIFKPIDNQSGTIYILSNPVLNYIKPYILFIVYFVLGLVSMFFSYYLLKKKDIN